MSKIKGALTADEEEDLFEDWLLRSKDIGDDDTEKEMLSWAIPPPGLLPHGAAISRSLVLLNSEMDYRLSDFDDTAIITDDIFEVLPETAKRGTCDDDDDDLFGGDGSSLHDEQSNDGTQNKPTNMARFEKNRSNGGFPFYSDSSIGTEHTPPSHPAPFNPYAKHQQQPQVSTSIARPQQQQPRYSQTTDRSNNDRGTHHDQRMTQPHPAPALYNPYQHGNSERSMPPPPTTQPTISSSQQWEAHNNRHQHQQQRGQNPFQTALEVMQPNRPDPPLANSHHQPPNSPPPPPPPPIRESLKRKFQQPKRGGTQPTKSSSQPLRNQSNASQQQQQRKPDGDAMDEDDDLPEELRMFGKELVESIENEIMSNCESITFAQIAGLNDQKAIVQEVVCWPLQRPDLFTGLRRAPNGLLLYGPPGTGKTLIGKAIAHESGATFFGISSSSLTSKWMGQGEKLVRTLFAVAAYRQPAVVFIDEIDSLLKARSADENEASRRIKTEFLVQIDGVGNRGRVLVIGATNRPQELDEAARRRFTKRLYIPLPSEEDRECLLRVLLEASQHTLNEANLRKLAVDTAGFSGADLKSMSVDAAMGPLRELGPAAMENISATDIPAIELKHFEQALASMRPSVAPQDIVQYEEWDKLYGSKRATGL